MVPAFEFSEDYNSIVLFIGDPMFLLLLIDVYPEFFLPDFELKKF